MNELHETARALVAEGKGILAADESTGTIKKRFDSIGIESTEDTRRAYRELLFTTPGAEEYISGVILYDETIRQSASDGTPFSKLLDAKGPHPWELSFSYGRALQAAAIKAWGGKPENVEAAQRAYYHRAKMNSAARTGTYAPVLEREAVAV